MCKKQETLEYSVLNEMSSTNYSPQGSGIGVKGKEERILELEVMNDSKKHCLPDTTGLIYK